MPLTRLLAAVVLTSAAFAAPAAENTVTTLQNKIAQCQGCHGIVGWKTAFPEVYHVPKLGGQKPDYIIAALKEYQSGERDFGTMRAMASDLSEKDMQDLAAYFGGLAEPNADVAPAAAASAPAGAPAAAPAAPEKK